MWKTCRDFSTLTLSGVKRTFSNQSVTSQKRFYLVSVNGYFMSSNLKTNSQVEKYGPFLSPGIPTSNRHFSTVETLDTLSKTLQGSPVDLCQNFSIWVHSSTSLPWWASLILQTIILRVTISLPLSIYMRQLRYRREIVQSELEGFQWKLKTKMDQKARQNNWSESKEKFECWKTVREEKRKLYIKYNCHPMKQYVILILQLGIFVSQTFAIRNLCTMLPVSDAFAYVTKMELSFGGIGWFTNLTKPDNYYILPLISSFFVFCVVQASNQIHPSQATGLWKKIGGFMTVLYPLLAMIISSSMPTAVVLSWLTNSIINYSEIVLFGNPKVRQLLSLPKSGKDIDRPLAFMTETFNMKLQLERLKKSF